MKAVPAVVTMLVGVALLATLIGLGIQAMWQEPVEKGNSRAMPSFQEQVDQMPYPLTPKNIRGELP